MSFTPVLPQIPLHLTVLFLSITLFQKGGSLQIFNLLRFLVASVIVIINPKKTDSIIAAARRIAKPERFKDPIDVYKSLPGGAEMLEKKPLFPKFILDELIKLPPDTLGHTYATHMKLNNLDPDFANIDFHDDISYMFYRYGKVHDLWHVLAGFDTSLEGEIGVLAFTYGQTLGPGSIMIASLFFLHLVLFKPTQLRKCVATFQRGLEIGQNSKPLYMQNWEAMMGKPFNDVRRELSIPI